MRHDRAGDAGAVDMRTFLAAERVEAISNRVRKLRMLEVDSGIDHRNGDVGAVGQRMCLGQSKFCKRVLRGIAFGQCRLLVLQYITEIRLHRANAGVTGEFAAHRLDRAAVGDAEQADGCAYQRKILRYQTREPVTPRQFIGLRFGQ